MLQPLDPTKIEQFAAMYDVPQIVAELERVPTLKKYAETPFFLNIMCMVYSNDGKLGNSRPAMLDRFMTIALADKAVGRDCDDATRTKAEADAAGVIAQLATLAYHIVEEGQGTQVTRQWAAERVPFEVLDKAEAASILIPAWQASENDKPIRGVKFYHQSQQDWLAGRGKMAELGQPIIDVLRAIARIGKQHYLDKLAAVWTEVLFLVLEEYAGREDVQITNEDIGKCILAIAKINYFLAAHSIGRVKERVPEEVQQAIIDRLDSGFNTGYYVGQNGYVVAIAAVDTLLARKALHKMIVTNDDPERQRIVVEHFLQIGGEVIDIRLTLKDGSARTRKATVSALQFIKGTIDELRPMLRDTDESVRIEALRLLPKLKGTLDDIRPMLQDSDKWVRIASVQVLPQLGGTAEDLRPMLNDPEEGVRAETKEIMRNMRLRQNLPPEEDE